MSFFKSLEIWNTDFFPPGGSDFDSFVKVVQNLKSQVSDKFRNQVLVISF